MSFLSHFTEVDPNLSVPIGEWIDVYLLILRGEVVYVGRTKHLAWRLVSHRTGARTCEKKQFDRAFKITVPLDEGAAYEGALMRHFVPRYCGRVEVDASRDDEIITAFGLPFREGGHEALTKHRRSRNQRLALNRVRPALARAIWSLQ